MSEYLAVSLINQMFKLLAVVAIPLFAKPQNFLPTIIYRILQSLNHGLDWTFNCLIFGKDWLLHYTGFKKQTLFCSCQGEHLSQKPISCTGHNSLLEVCHNSFTKSVPVLANLVQANEHFVTSTRKVLFSPRGLPCHTIQWTNNNQYP